MGLGDEIMVTGEARRLQALDPRPVAVSDGRGRGRFHWLWEGSQRILRPEDARGKDCQWLVNGPGRRPYIDYVLTRKERWAYTGWRVTVPELHVPPEAMAWAGRWADAVVIEPHIKPTASPNKQWGWDRWQQLVRLCPDLPWVQPGARGARVLDGVERVETAEFWQAVALLAHARAAVLPEGALHHAAAAVGLSAVVLFGHLCSPANTGYDLHVNVTKGGPCGWRVPCGHCARAWAELTPEAVAEMLQGLLARRVA